MSTPQPTGDVQQAYDGWAARYDCVANATRDLADRVLRQQRQEIAGRCVLEVGCGTGLNTGWLAEHARYVVAFDSSQGMLEKARAHVRATHVGLLRADATRPWPLVSTFDAVVVNLVLEHVADLGHVFGEARRLLAPGGWLYLGELHPYRQLRGAQAKYVRPEDGEEVAVPAFRHSVSDFVNAGLEAGLELRHLGEWASDDEDVPRILTLHFRAPGPTSGTDRMTS